MPEVWYLNAADSQEKLYHYVDMYGERSAPRGLETKEVRGLTIKIHDPADCLSVGVGRKINTKLAALEALQLIAGEQHPELMRRVAPNTARFMTGGAFDGAYGPRLRNQLPKIIERLVADPDTRQAVAVLWDPMNDLHGDSVDIPCTVYLSFRIVDFKLHMYTHMRSNDLYWGWTYDVVQFTQLQACLASALGVEMGFYTHYADSFHFYERDRQNLEQLYTPTNGRVRVKPYGLLSWITVQASAQDRWSAITADARCLLRNVAPSKINEPLWLSTQAALIHEGQ